jgi:hypothetical protein
MRLLAPLTPLVLLAACSVDDVDFSAKTCPCDDGYSCDPSRNVCVLGSLPDAGSDSGGSGGSSGAGGSGGAGGTSGAGGSGNCASTEKLCAGSCVSKSDPSVGCSSDNCDPCPPPPNAQATCVSGACGLGGCEQGFADCNGEAADGCEESDPPSSAENCGACGNDCTSQGSGVGFACASDECRCTTSSQCAVGGGTSGTCDTTTGLCTCDAALCARGEACAKVGAANECRCNGGAACVPGQTCCPVVGCKDLALDAANCGACGKKCASGQACLLGICS